MTLLVGLLPSKRLEPPTGSCWMAAYALLVVVQMHGKNQSDEQDHNREYFVIGHAITSSFVGGEKPGAIFILPAGNLAVPVSIITDGGRFCNRSSALLRASEISRRKGQETGGARRILQVQAAPLSLRARRIFAASGARSAAETRAAHRDFQPGRFAYEV